MIRALQINADRFCGCLDRSMHEYAGQFMPLVEAWIDFHGPVGHHR